MSSQPSPARPGTAQLDAFDATGVAGCTGPRPAVCTPRWSVSYPPPPTAPDFPPTAPGLSAPAASNSRVYVGVDTIQPLASFTRLDA